MCNKCKKKSCSGCGSSNDLADLKNQVAELMNTVSEISENTKFLNGHPIFCIQNEDDIALFNMDTGLGSGFYESFALCNGAVQYSNNAKKFITTPNFLDKFIICTGESYPLNTTGGVPSVTLSLNQIPSHNHTVNDSGHSHDVTDPGHNHGASSGSHTHTISTSPHTHTAETENTHTHGLLSVFSVDYNGGTGPFKTAVGYEGGGTNYGGDKTLAGSAHTHTISSSSVSATASSEAVGVSVSDAFIGITQTEVATTGITTQNIGGGLSHENMPPYYSAIYIIKL